MIQCSGGYGLTAQQVLIFLRDHPGELFTAEDICEQTDCPTTHARIALETLARTGVIDREQMVGGRAAYRFRKY